MPSESPLFLAEAPFDEIVAAARALLQMTLATPNLVARRHPLGFVYIRLCDTLRLHLWPTVRDVQDAELLVHDHTFSFRSRVLIGELENAVYEVKEVQHAEKELYLVRYEDGRSVLTPTGNCVELGHVAKTHVPQFGLYEMQAGTFHETIMRPVTFGCTVLAVAPSEGSVPRVVGPSSGISSEFKRREVGVDEVRTLLERALTELCHTAG